jgi:hypothetical protein
MRSILSLLIVLIAGGGMQSATSGRDSYAQVQTLIDQKARLYGLGHAAGETQKVQKISDQAWWQEFDRGVVYWTAAYGAHPVRGEILAKWSDSKRERGRLGFPVTDDLACNEPSAHDRYQIFEGGRIYTRRETGEVIIIDNPTSLGDNAVCLISSVAGSTLPEPSRVQRHPAEASLGQGHVTRKIQPQQAIFGRSLTPVPTATSPPFVTSAPVIDVSPTPFNFPTALLPDRSPSGRIMSLAVADDSVRLYAGTNAGIWRSDDAGRSWFQLTRPEPSPGQAEAPGSLMAPDASEITVAPRNRDLVLAAADGDTRIQPRNGIYRSSDGGLSWALVHQFRCPWGPSVGEIVFAPDDPNLVFAAGGCGIAISTDSGVSWVDHSLIDGGVHGTVWRIAVAPQAIVAVPPGVGIPTAPFRRVYAAANGQIWHSIDAGTTWHFDKGQVPAQIESIAIEPRHEDQLLAAVPSLANGPSYFQPVDQFGADGKVHCNPIKFVDNTEPGWSEGIWHAGDPAIYDADNNGIFDAFDSVLGGNFPPLGSPLIVDRSGPGFPPPALIKFVDANGNHMWDTGEVLVFDSNDNGLFDLGEQVVGGFGTGTPAISTPLTLPRPCGEGSLWKGDYSNFWPSHVSQWTQLPGPPAYYGGSTRSGRSYVKVFAMGTQYLVFFSDGAHVHVAQGLPSEGSWHRVDGKDVSQAWAESNLSNQLFVHVDPWALTVSKNFLMYLYDPRPGDPPIPPDYRANKVAAAIGRAPGSPAGTIWMSNDGGVFYHSDSDPNAPWTLAAGLSTLKPTYISGAILPGRAPSLYMGTGDNDSFFSIDGGLSWGGTATACGDCGSWFLDPVQPDRVLAFTPRNPAFAFELFTAPSGQYVNASTSGLYVPCPSNSAADCLSVNVSSSDGYRPVILSMPNEQLSGDGDYVIFAIRADGSRGLLRTSSASSIRSDHPEDWNDPAKASSVGPPFPLCSGSTSCVHVVQASGGHSNPVFFIGDESSDNKLWKWSTGTSWQPLVPGTGAVLARRFFADPYDPNVIYIIDSDGIKRSDTGGPPWQPDTNLFNAVTENGIFSLGGSGSAALIKDVIFDRTNPSRRFAVANSGVFFTSDGSTWTRLLSTSAVPGHPVGGFLDNVSNAGSWALYVAMDGRGIVRIDPPVQTLSLNVTLSSIRVVRTIDPIGPAELLVTAIVNGQEVDTGLLTIAPGGVIPLPAGLNVKVDIHPDERLNLEMDAEEDNEPSSGPSGVSKPPHPPGYGRMVFRSSFDAAGRFGLGVHPTQASTTFQGEHFEVSYTISLAQ